MQTKKNNDRLIALLILLVGTVALLIATLSPRPLADRITDQFTPEQEQVEENGK